MKVMVNILNEIVKDEKFECQVINNGETFEKQIISVKTLFYMNNSKQTYNLYFETPVTFKTISIEEYDGEYDVTLNKYYCDGEQVQYSDEHIGTWKRQATAVNKANEAAKYNDALEIINSAC